MDIIDLEAKTAMIIFFTILREVHKKIDQDESVIVDFIDSKVKEKAKEFYDKDKAHYFVNEATFFLPTQKIREGVVEHGRVDAKQALLFHLKMYKRLPHKVKTTSVRRQPQQVETI